LKRKSGFQRYSAYEIWPVYVSGRQPRSRTGGAARSSSVASRIAPAASTIRV